MIKDFGSSLNFSAHGGWGKEKNGAAAIPKTPSPNPRLWRGRGQSFFKFGIVDLTRFERATPSMP